MEEKKAVDNISRGLTSQIACIKGQFFNKLRLILNKLQTCAYISHGLLNN